MQKVDTHVVEIFPPNSNNPMYRAVCSFKDFSKTYLNRVSAYEAGTKHINDVMVVSELERGTYQFDDGSR